MIVPQVSHQNQSGKTIDFKPQRRVSPLWIIGAAVLVLIVGGLGVSGYLLLSSKQAAE